MANSQFYWTSEEIYTKSGFYVGPADSSPDPEEVVFLVLRVKDERSSELCKKIEEMSQSNGGIVIRPRTYSVLNSGFGSDYYSGLFHENCRCRLIIKPKALYREIDELDFQMAAGKSSVSYNELYRAEKNLEESQFKQYTSPSFQNRVRDIMSSNFRSKK